MHVEVIVTRNPAGALTTTVLVDGEVAHDLGTGDRGVGDVTVRVCEVDPGPTGADQEWLEAMRDDAATMSDAAAETLLEVVAPYGPGSEWRNEETG